MDNLYNRNRIGLAGEFRVMSELLLRGHNPAKSFLEEGADMVLENGLRVEVKSGHRCHCSSWGERHRIRDSYLFTFRGGAKKRKPTLQDLDIAILWLMDDDCFLIIPSKMITGNCIGIDKLSSKSKYAIYKDNWGLLDIPKEAHNR